MTFAEPLLRWYEENARELPWRSAPSPYRTWVSEVMLQQTQVETVLPYFSRWMARFPDAAALAEADEQAVLGFWEGLGYYSRARNLHAAARKVMSEHGGCLPDTLEALQALPGIGRYTAAAIASIAFGRDVAAVDANIRRVLSRLFDVQEPARSAAGEKRLWALAQEHLPPGRAGAYNQAMMDLGALICTPRDPACGACPLAEGCQALALGVQAERPVLPPRKKVPHHTVTAAVIVRDGRVLLAQRNPDGLLGGMWEFPGGTLEAADVDLPACLTREIREELGVGLAVGRPLGVYRHAYTHFKITLHAFVCELPPGEEPQALEAAGLVWARPGALGDYPMGKVDRRIAKRLIQEEQDGKLF
jgi:A/G-specific adenine glycosylase